MTITSEECIVPASVTAQVQPPGFLPDVTTSLPVENYAPKLPGLTCEPSPKAGVLAFRELVLNNLGGGDSGICRDCGSVPPSSDHHEGRAWDWRVDAGNPEDVERVTRLFHWLTAPGPSAEPDANFRRAGLRYMIWDRKSFSSLTREWRPYGGIGKSPHRDHVHFSFGRAGSDGQTSLYAWLGSLNGHRPPPVTPPTSPPSRPALGLGGPLALILGVAAGWGLVGGAVALARART